MYYVYILQVNNQAFYIGYSSDLKKRVRSHQENQVISTKHKNPKLIWYSAFQFQSQATAFEKYLTSSSGFAFRNKHFV